MGDLEQIGASPATALRVPSQTSKETKTCKCGKEFTTWTAGEECHDCMMKRVEAERVVKMQAELPERQANQSEIWHEECGPGLQPRFLDKTFANYDQSLQPKAWKAMSLWDKDEEPGSILLLSPDLYGVGKTHLASALVRHLLQTKVSVVINRSGVFRPMPCPVYFTGEVGLLGRLRATFQQTHEDGESEQDVYDQLSVVNLLIIDDVGKVRSKDPSFLQSVYYRIIDDRYGSEMPIILLSILSLSELENHIGGACADRLREMCGKNIFTMKGRRQRLPPLT